MYCEDLKKEHEHGFLSCTLVELTSMQVTRAPGQRTKHHPNIKPHIVISVEQDRHTTA